MKEQLSMEAFNYLSEKDKEFIIHFDAKLEKLGFTCDSEIGPGYCWGNHMIIYRKKSVKSKKVYARIYFRENSILLRLFLNKIDKHREYIETAPDHIKDVFVGGTGTCTHCHNEKDGNCKFRKTYSIDDALIEKCNGVVFEFYNPTLDKLADYISLFEEFHSKKN